MLSVTVMVVAVVSVAMMVCRGQIFAFRLDLCLPVVFLVSSMCATVIVLCGLRGGWSGRSGVGASCGSLFCVWRVVVVVRVVVRLVVLMIMTVSFTGG